MTIETITDLEHNRTLTYDGVGIKSLLGFRQNEYKSIGVDKQMLDDFIQEGNHPFDVLVDREPSEKS
jgi:hypothetical protein